MSGTEIEFGLTMTAKGRHTRRRKKRTTTRPTKNELAHAYAQAQQRLQAIEKAIADGAHDRERYLETRRDLAEAHAQVLAWFRGRRADRDPL